MGDDRLLYGQSGDEYLELDPESVLEKWLDQHGVEDDTDTLDIEVHDVYPAITHVPSAEVILDWFKDRDEIEFELFLDWLAEAMCEMDLCGFGEMCEDIQNAMGHAAVKALAAVLVESDDGAVYVQPFRLLVAEQLHFSVARNVLRTIHCTQGPADEWLMDGEPCGVHTPVPYIPVTQPDPKTLPPWDRIRRLS